jgi:hypothetical protein
MLTYKHKTSHSYTKRQSYVIMIHTYMHTHINTDIHTYIPGSEEVSSVCMLTCLHTCIHTYTHTNIQPGRQTEHAIKLVQNYSSRICMDTYKYIQNMIYMYIYIYIYIHIVMYV